MDFFTGGRQGHDDFIEAEIENKGAFDFDNHIIDEDEFGGSGDALWGDVGNVAYTIGFIETENESKTFE